MRLAFIPGTLHPRDRGRERAPNGGELQDEPDSPDGLAMEFGFHVGSSLASAKVSASARRPTKSLGPSKLFSQWCGQFLERLLGRTGDNFAIGFEPRAMAGAIPSPFSGIPAHDAFQVRANR